MATLRYVGFKSNIGLSVAALLVAFFCAEVTFRLLVEPSGVSSGRLFGIELPPRDALPRSLIPPQQRSVTLDISRSGSIMVDGNRVTPGDLRGLFREDPLLGYAPRENASSANGWWQSNELGARSRHDIPFHTSPQRERILLFGDSFTQGSRLQQEQTFAYVLHQKSPRVEVVNFGVDGYGIGQAYLRFRSVKDKLRFDKVLLLAVPSIGLWRDINVNRYVGERWPLFMTNPRFVIEGGELTLVASPYKTMQELLDDNQNSISEYFKTHLRRYDRFYSAVEYEATPLLDLSISFRLLKAAVATHEKDSLRRGLIDPDSEAMRVTKKIIDAMAGEVALAGAEFSLMVLPYVLDVKRYVYESDFPRTWDRMTSYLCTGLPRCFDLMSGFKTISTIDTGYDGTHYGPATNRFIADLIWRVAIRKPELDAGSG